MVMARKAIGIWPSLGDTFLVGLAFCVWSSFVEGDAGGFSEFRLEVEPTNSVVQRERPASLECGVHYPQGEYDVEWIKDEVPVTYDNRRTKLSNGTLHFTSVDHSRSSRPDEGVYQCVATVSGLGSLVSRKASLKIAYLDRVFTEEPADTTVHLQDNVMLPCYIDGAPVPDVTWYKGEEQIYPERAPNKIVHADGVLEINDVVFVDFARYRCSAMNVERSTESEEMTLRQDSDGSTYQGVPPHFIMEPRDRVAVEGTSVMLYCGANGRDRHEALPTITWLKDGGTIELPEDPSASRFSIVGHGSLRIDSLQEIDTGSYTCRAENQEDSIDADVTLTVHVPPRFRKRPRNVVAHVNADVELECDVGGTPRPSVSWLKDGDKVINSGYFQITEGRNLKILGLIESDAGMYQCFGENVAGSVQASAQLVIEAAGVPATRHNPSELPSAPTHLTSRIVAERFVTLAWRMPDHTGGSEISSYSIFWREEGSNRERVLNTTSMEANVQHLKPGTSYDFRLLAYNRVGASPEAASLSIETTQEVRVPGKPSNLVAYTIDPTAIKITWASPIEANGGIDHYKLHYYETGGDRELEVDVPITAYTLTGLRKFTQYNIRVVAFNENGPGISTDEVTRRTFSDIPSAPPQNVTLETMSSTSIIVRWEPPPEDQQNGLITGYKIRYRERNERGSYAIATDATRRTYALSELKKGAEYQIRMQALTVNGSGPASEWLTAETYLHDLDESAVPGMPSSLQVRPLTDSIVVSWTPPIEQDIMIRGYILGHGIGIPDVYKQIIGAKNRYHTIKNLSPSSEYVVTLRAYNNIGEGRPKYETVTTGEQAVTEPLTPMIPPVGLKATVFSATTILLTWSDSTLDRNQRVTDSRVYMVRYSMKNQRKYKTVNSTDLNYHFRELRPNTEYEFSVKVLRDRRQSSWSLSAFNTTFEAAPSMAPRQVTAVKVKGRPKWVQLNWQPPRQPNGQITGYLVYYTVNPSQVQRDWAVEGVLGDKLSATIRDLRPDTTYYFKVLARNSKGYGPVSPTAIYVTPREDGTGGGPVEVPDDAGRPIGSRDDSLVPVQPLDPMRPYDVGNKGAVQEEEEEEEGFPMLVLWVSIGTVIGVAVPAAIVITYLCRKRQQDASRRHRNGGGYKKAPMKPGPKDLKPPDLWIHDQMELKGMEKSTMGDGSVMVTPMARGDHDGKSADDHMHSEKNYDPRDDDRYSRTPLRPKPIMIPVDQPPPPREPIAMAVPNGHMGLMGEAPMPIRPIYPRTQCGSQFSSTPRVNAGDISQHSSEEQNHSSTLERRKAKDRLKKTSASSSRVPAVRPQQQPASPHKKSSARTPMAMMNANQAPDVTVPAGKEDAADVPLQKSYSTEELTAEMANLEGLMKDLNAITQQEFEC